MLDAAISPDGRYVVHSVDDGGGQSLWVRQVATSSNVEIVPASNVLYLGMTFSRDGDYVYYVSRARGQPMGVLYQIPVLGGAPRRLIDDVDTSVTFSPDGSRLAFIRNYPDDRTSSVVVANADGTGERRLSTSAPPSFFPVPADERNGPAWSPDGKTIACVVDITDAKGRHSEIAVVDAGDGTLRELTTRRWYSVRRVGWLADGSGVLAAVADTSSAYPAHQVWLAPYPGGEPRKITTDLNNYAGMSMTASGDAFVAVQTTGISNVWVAPGGDSAAALAVTTGGTTFDGLDGLAWTPDGRILYASLSLNGSYDLWTMKPDGSDRQPLVVNAGANLESGRLARRPISRIQLRPRHERLPDLAHRDPGRERQAVNVRGSRGFCAECIARWPMGPLSCRRQDLAGPDRRRRTRPPHQQAHDASRHFARRQILREYLPGTRLGSDAAGDLSVRRRLAAQVARPSANREFSRPLVR